MHLKYKTARLLSSMALSVLCTGELMISSSLVSSSIAADIQKPSNIAKLDFNEFMDGVSQHTRLKNAEADKARAAIQSLFQKYPRVDDGNKTAFINEVDALANTKVIWGRQAGAIKEYLDKKLAPVVANVPLDPHAWTQNIAKTVNAYFSKPYAKDPKRKEDCKKGYTIFRPNHALAHGLRQGLFALDIVDGLNDTTLNLQSPEALKIRKWVKTKIATDPNFRQKIEFASAFQRTGRESEASSSTDKDLYDSYERKDAVNFDKDVRSYVGPGKMFKDMDEAGIYKEAILWSTAHEGKLDENKNEDLYFIRRIFHAAHDLDLRRMTKFTSNWTKSDAAGELFGPNAVAAKDSFTMAPNYKAEGEFINKLWARSGEYLKATGDRDNSVHPKKIHRSEEFCKLAMDPSQMATVLVNTRKNSNVTF